ncbi:head maturation protease, ClpP-related [Streptomyces misionensis]|uniref:head maturation protease, ClpP-related n=1 Tax=Streptomyces misionensis TaxID=67331 RepID=UPI0034466B47
MKITLPGKAAAFQANQRERAERQRAQLGVEARSWYRITNAASDEAEVMLYDEIGGWLGATADEFIADLKGITAKNMRVRVNSPGGSVFEGIAIANALRSHPSTVTVQVDGIAASIASVIAMAGDKVVMQPQSMLMVHDASGMCFGNAADMGEMGSLLDKISDNIADAYAARAGGTRDDWRQTMRAETWYTADEAVKAGLADEVMQTPKKSAPDEAEPEMRRRYDLTAYGYQGPPQKTEPSLTINIGAALDEDFVKQLRAMVRENGTAAAVAEVKAVMRQFDEGDRVAVIKPHEPGHTQGTIAVVNGNAYGVIFDGEGDDDTEPGEPYLWYTDDELQFVAEGEDGGGQDGGDGYGQPTEDEPILPGVSHPMGVPTSQADIEGIVDTACPVHHTATEDRPWDASPNEKRLPSPMTVKTAKAMYAWYDDSQVTDGEVPKTACKLPHHEVSADGTPGAANLSGVRNALARLPQSDIPASQHDAVRRHLQAHLDDAKSADNHTDGWAELTAHLIQDDADNWSASVSHLTDTTASPSAAEA